MKRYSNIVVALIIISATSVGCMAKEEIYQLKSPDGKVRIAMLLKDGHPYYNLSFNDRVIIEDSQLGIAFNDKPILQKFKVVEKTFDSHNSVWRPVWGRSSEIQNHYNRMVVRLLEQGEIKHQLDLEFRCFNDGVGFRYVFGKQHNPDEYIIASENTEFCFAGDYTVWFPNSKWGVSITGPVSLSRMPTEQTTTKKTNKQTRKKPLIGTPMTIRINAHCYLCITEATLDNYATMNLARVKGRAYALKSQLASEVKVTTAHSSPWRCILLGERPGELIESNLIGNLNEPCVLKDTSWIKPGKTMWDWRVRGAKVDGFTYGLDTASIKRLIDFAAGASIDYIMIDAGWYGPERDPDSDPTTSIDDIDIQYLAKYANRNGVGCWLYVNSVALRKYDLDKIFLAYRKWRISGIKHGYLSDMSAKGVNFCHKVLKKAAEYHLMYDCHEAIKPSGFRRTYPNFMTREYCHSLTDGRRLLAPEYFVKLPFVNMVAGPLDHTPGMFDLNTAKERDKVWGDIKSTVVAQAARCVVIFTGLLCLPDHGEAYQKKSDLFDFIKQLPMTWDQTRVLNGEIGEYITIARRKDKEWFVGSLTDEKRHTIDIPLNFLPPGRYTATIYADAADAHYIENREAYTVKKITVDSGDIVKAKLAPGGGHSMWIRPANEK